MAQKVSHWPLFAEDTVRSLFSSGEICDGQCGTGRRLLRLLRFSAVSIIATQLHIHHHIYTGLFISPSGTSELDCATTKTDTAERSISIGRESLEVCKYALAYLQVPPLWGSRDENGVHSE